jgi:uncharacterized protein (DUF58 family)
MASAASLRLRQLGGAGSDAGAGLVRLAEVLHLTVTGLAVLPLLVGGWLLARVIGARTMYLMVYAAALAMGAAWFVARRRLAMEVERSDLPTRMRVGQRAGVDLRVRARRRVSTILLQESLDPRLGSPVSLPVASLRPSEELEHRYALAPSVRGVYQVGPLVAVWSDPFGFTTHTQQICEPVEVIVHPHTENARDRVLSRMWEDPPVRPPVSKPWPVGFEFYGMRDYVPGDDLRRVVWAQVAKTGKMMVRESEQGITDRVVIFVDTYRDRHSPGVVSDTFETAVRAAASVGSRHLEDGFAVTLMTNDGPVVSGLRGKKASMEYLDALARLDMSETPLANGGQHLVDAARGRAHLLVLTPHVDQQSAGRLRLLIDRGASVIIAGVMWDESDPHSLTRAAAIGARVLQIPPGASLAGVFQARGGIR